ncbi:MAG TPA: radical SAM protein [Candidatus Omnitrophota bacterium]|nr:radical SAM protein [Candidatus Omnitrophota bacterium]HQQ06712.1 radical SAM protein [Candidatus Omnitrophota bacterium]
MKILLINEPFVKDFCRTQRWAARTRGRVLRAPDWLAYATAVLERAGHDARLFDMVAEDLRPLDIAGLARTHSPDFVVLDSTTPSIYSDIECARMVKEASKARVIMVGPHVSALPAETLRASAGAVDVACIGEYDLTVKDVVEGSSRLATIPGIAYWSDNAAVVNPARPLIEDLDALPFPAWHHLDLMKYFDGGKLYPYIDIISGRGCPNRCIFCLWPQVMHGTRYRLRSPANVVDEIEHDIRLCPRVRETGEFFFEDDTFTVNKQRALAICDEIRSRGLHITFSVNARVDTADRELFRAMKQAGCRELLVGFESGSQQQLERMHKNLRTEQAREFMACARRAGLEVHGCFVIGLPGETEESCRQTIDFARGLGLTTAQFSGAVPFPGTGFFELCSKQGWLTAKSWSDWLQEGEQSGVVDYPGLSRERINHYVDLGLKKFYFRPVYMVNFLLRTRSLSDLYRKIKGAFNFACYLVRRKGPERKTV